MLPSERGPGARAPRSPPGRPGARDARRGGAHGRTMSFLKFLGLGESRAGGGAGHESRSVRAIAARLERLPPDQARYLAGFAYVLARVANVDLDVADSEVGEMERILRDLGGLSEEEAHVVVGIARSQARELGGTQNYLVTRDFRECSTPEQRVELLHCLFAVAAADGSISSGESDEVLGIAEELGFTRPEALGIRSRYREYLSSLRGLPGR